MFSTPLPTYSQIDAMLALWRSATVITEEMPQIIADLIDEEPVWRDGDPYTAWLGGDLYVTSYGAIVRQESE